ncbi:phosphate ABC transporter permease subunit PstC [Sphingobacterium cellulitidis]|uniref:phosphate ABC transporter permease subunit PstC n=1 Tax=Sphingobacterium cellulitidis TaxID=1768011 RepID=UPI000B9418F1|nr:phosphate ABC transporter permease subunit PstC [Sphingobacterium cellulitidis]OYD41988.1 phosphate ABC transporter permease subunit PstC [Sphingobacterium cellulitidis]OYD46756.1 phosphate ABC transporter permease subunit PstC [Sphingobacterium cellulitidis]
MKYRARLSMDVFFKYVFKATGFLVLALLGGILAMLVYNSFSFFLDVKPLDFITGMEWNPTGKNPKYGMVPLILSTTIVTFGAMLIAIPLGIGTAAFIAEYASPRLKNILKPAIEMLAAIPSVVIGFLGIVVVSPGIASLADLSNGLNALNGAILLAVMALPTIITVAEDAIHAVPKTYKEASYGVGATKWQTLCKVVIPAAAPGIIAAVMLGVGRAIGETMTVLMATGNASILPTSMFDSVKTMTATIAIEMGEVPYQTTHYFALYAIATVLFIMTLAANMLGEYFINRFRKYHAA